MYLIKYVLYVYVYMMEKRKDYFFENFDHIYKSTSLDMVRLKIA